MKFKKNTKLQYLILIWLESEHSCQNVQNISAEHTVGCVRRVSMCHIWLKWLLGSHVKGAGHVQKANLASVQENLCSLIHRRWCIVARLETLYSRGK